MTRDQKAFVAFKAVNGHYRPSILLDDLLESGDLEMETLLQRAAVIYGNSIDKMRLLVQRIETSRKSRKPVAARMIWQLGNAIWGLTNELGSLSLQLDDLYGHLERDIGLKRKRLEKIVIFRRYLPTEDIIPEALSWGTFEKGTKKMALKLLNNHSNV